MKKQTLLIILAGILVLLVVVQGYRFYLQRQTETRPIMSDAEILKRLQKKPLNHLGIIMDGNRRWAKQHGYKPWIGHRQGVEPVKEAMSFCKEHGIQHLTLYVFSLENFNRPQEELSYLFDILAQEIASKEMENLFKENVRVRFIGDRSLFPQQLVPIIADIEQKTAAHSGLYVNLLFCYGGQQEIAAAARAAALEKNSAISHFADFKKYMWSAEVPGIDLIIRTAGDQRLSNFLPMQSAYSELYFTPCFWPELTKEDLKDAVIFFVSSKRNFGK